MDDLLGVPNERLKDLLAELPKGAYIWLEYIRNVDWTLEEKLAITAVMSMQLGQRVK